MASHFRWLCKLQGALLAIILLCTVRGAVCQSSSCLTAFKASVRDPKNNLATWVESTPVCEWSYVMCLHPTGNDVGELNLAGLGLQGELRLDLLKDCKQSLGKIDLSSNKFSGTIPPQLSVYIPNLVSLDLSNNAIHGPIPATIGQVQYLNVLYLQHNRLDGTIPPELGSLTRLKSLNLTRNQLKGTIPVNLLNHTEFIGTGENFTVEGGTAWPYPENAFLENARLRVPIGFCSMFPRIRCGNNEDDGKWGIHKWLIKCVVAGAVLVAVVVAFVLVAIIRRQRMYSKSREGEQPADLKSVKTESAKLIPFTVVSALESMGTEPVKVLNKKWGSRRGLIVQDLCAATANFDRESEIGAGSFSTVYRGTLRDGKLVAIKLVNLDNRGEPGAIVQHFVKEVEAVSTFRHTNLVKTLGYVAKEEMMLLVLEYMVEGSLEMQLYGYPYQSSDEKPFQCQLSWDQRYSIALGVAKGLKYLHQDAPKPVVHSDLNPSNILLDSSMTAFISPFGIAKLVSETAGSLASYWTVGYTAPEKVFSMKKSAKADVYSFGILLLELVTRQRPTSSLFGDGVTMSEWVKGALAKESFLSILDPALTNSWAFNEAQVVEMTLVCKLGLACSQDAAAARPDMKGVVDILQQRVKNREKLSAKWASVEDILGAVAV